MATKTTATEADEIAAGGAAYALAVLHRVRVEPRLPVGMIDALGADLVTLGARVEAPSPAPAGEGPGLTEAIMTLEQLVSAVHEAVRGAKAAPAVRKAYGAGSRATGRDVAATVTAGEAIVARVGAKPGEALGLGILAEDVAALEKAIADVKRAEGKIKAGGAVKKVTGKERRAAMERVRACPTENLAAFADLWRNV